MSDYFTKSRETDPPDVALLRKSLGMLESLQFSGSKSYGCDTGCTQKQCPVCEVADFRSATLAHKPGCKLQDLITEIGDRLLAFEEAQP